MAQNIWDATLDVDNNVKQNSFDWNHTNNLTTQIGRLTPVFCDLVPAKTSFRVKPSFGLQFMPMVFPIQTRMRASISFFRYPLRALWKDYKDFVGNFRQGLEEPYINFNTADRLKKMASTGSLGDYLGLPSTLSGEYGAQFTDSFNYTSAFYDTSNAELSSITNAIEFNAKLNANPAILPSEFNLSTRNSLPTSSSWKYASGNFINSEIGGNFTVKMNIKAAPVSGKDYNNQILAVVFNEDYGLIYASAPATINSSGEVVANFKISDTRKISGLFSVGFYIHTSNPNGTSTGLFPDSNFGYASPTTPLIETTGAFKMAGVSEITLTTSPWYNSSNSASSDNQVKISAYAFRAYEGIYNAFYRDNRNNPYYVNGEVQYNQWIPSYDGGVDNNLYELRYANWERDFLTTAVHSPQQGQAPLVGITTYTATGVMTNTDGTSSEVPVQKVALVDETGKRYSVEFQSDDEGLTGVNYVELENGVTVRSARNLLDLATSGISIPDLRMVNCYQKFLELNMRKGYSYKEIVEGRFDVNVKYADLLLPQFFGGFSRDMNMNAITQTIDQDSSGSGNYREALGSQAGVGYFSGNTDYNIECFCDEESIIMGILVVSPLPVYTQLLPKHFTYRGLLDHFNPEFNNIGFQPISYKEVCPIQAYNDNPASLNGTFGYQRPWYEYCQRYDQAHGLFRTSLSNFLMHRVFDVKPELAQSFLVIDPEQVTDVFSVTETTDKIYGQIRFEITCKLPVARVAIPRLD
nr:MAG: major capsid protein [Microviridae sp.]